MSEKEQQREELGRLAIKTVQDFVEKAEPYKQHLAILFADMVASTRYKEERPLLSWLNKTRLHNETVRNTAEKYGGKWVKYIGDAVMVTFRADDQAHVALNAAIRIQEELNCLNEKESRKRGLQKLPPLEKIQCKIGISAGQVYEFYQNDYYGIPVDIAARLTTMAKPEQILIDDNLKALIAPGKLTAELLNLRPTIRPEELISEPVQRTIRGITGEVIICEVKWKEEPMGIIDEKQLALEWKIVHEHLHEIASNLYKDVPNLVRAGEFEVARRKWRRIKQSPEPYWKLLDFVPSSKELQFDKNAIEHMEKLTEAYTDVGNALNLGKPTFEPVDDVFQWFEEKIAKFMKCADDKLKEYLTSRDR